MVSSLTRAARRFFRIFPDTPIFASHEISGGMKLHVRRLVEEPRPQPRPRGYGVGINLRIGRHRRAVGGACRLVRPSAFKRARRVRERFVDPPVDGGHGGVGGAVADRGGGATGDRRGGVDAGRRAGRDADPVVDVAGGGGAGFGGLVLGRIRTERHRGGRRRFVLGPLAGVLPVGPRGGLAVDGRGGAVYFPTARKMKGIETVGLGVACSETSTTYPATNPGSSSENETRH